MINRFWYPAGAARQVAAILIGGNCDRRPQLSKLKIPTMIIQGDSDPLVLLAAAKELVETIPGAELSIIKGMGHDLSIKFIDKIVGPIIKNTKRIKISKYESPNCKIYIGQFHGWDEVF